MNPISRLRTRARSDAERSATWRLFKVYDPLDGVSSRPRIDSNVDLPQPDGPAIETYSPRSTTRSMPASACVSTSSVRNTFVTPCSLINGSMSPPVRLKPDATMCPWPLIASPWPLLQSHAIECVPRGHVRQDDFVASLQPGDDFHGVHRRSPQRHLDARR